MTATDPSPVPPPISITVGAVRVRTVHNWPAARTVLRRMVNDAYLPNGGLTFRPLPHNLERDLSAILATIEAGPLNGLIIASAGADPSYVRVAQEGEHGLTVGDLCYLQDCPNGNYGWWTIRVKAKITAVDPDSGRVTARVTDWSASQFTHGEIAVVHADRVRPRPAKRGR